MARRPTPSENLLELTTPRLPRLTRIARSGHALHPTALTADTDVLGLNLLRGCAHRCPFCSVRGSPYYGGDDELFVYDDSSGRLAAELDSRQTLPRAVFVSPATDPYPPFTEIQEDTSRAVATLASRGVETWLMTRGLIRPRALAVLEAHRVQVKVTVSLTTCDRTLQRILEPWCASPRLRLKQIAELRRRGIPVQVALDPLIPGVTDTAANLSAVLAALAEVGVQRVSASYVYVREGILKNLAAALAPLGMDGQLLAEFEEGPLLTAPGMSAARYLPRNRRQRGYGRLISLAAAHGITASFNGTTNPDFAPPRVASAVSATRRLSLFMADK